MKNEILFRYELKDEPNITLPMSAFISTSTIQVIGEAAGITAIKAEVAAALAPDVEFRLRDLLQEAIKFQRHGRCSALTAEHVNFALRLRNCDIPHGYSSLVPPRLCRAVAPGVFYLEDAELNLADLLTEPLPQMPIDPGYTIHWLAINGVQPAGPQQPCPDDTAAAHLARREDPSQFSSSSLVTATPSPALCVRLELTVEEQEWLDRVTAAVQQHVPDSDGLIDPEAAKVHFASLRGVIIDPSTQPLSAHLAALVASEVNASARCLPRLVSTMRLLGAMLRSCSVNIEPYLHQILPSVLTCLVGKRLCATVSRFATRKREAHFLSKRGASMFARSPSRTTGACVSRQRT